MYGDLPPSQEATYSGGRRTGSTGPFDSHGAVSSVPRLIHSIEKNANQSSAFTLESRSSVPFSAANAVEFFGSTFGDLETAKVGEDQRPLSPDHGTWGPSPSVR